MISKTNPLDISIKKLYSMNSLALKTFPDAKRLFRSGAVRLRKLRIQGRILRQKREALEKEAKRI